MVGGKLRTIDSNAHLGTGRFMVVEADESDGSFEKLSPVVTVLTNIDKEHLDYYGDMKALELAFSNFLHKIPFYGLAVNMRRLSENRKDKQEIQQKNTDLRNKQPCRPNGREHTLFQAADIV